MFYKDQPLTTAIISPTDYEYYLIPPPYCPILTVAEGIVFHKGNSIGDIAVVECNAGNMMTGNPVMQCGPNGYWTGVQPGCERKIICDNLEKIALSIYRK